MIMENLPIPAQTTGASCDVTSSVQMDSLEEAQAFFQTVRQRFVDINSWKLHAGEEKASFSLREPSGDLLLREPKVGDYIRIQIPGLNNPGTDGYDWVQIEEVKEEDNLQEQCLYIRVRPCPDPTAPDTSVKHFYCPEATSNFLIVRQGKEIRAEVHGRNELPNTQEVGGLEKIRNFLVAIGGILAGSKFQWKSLTEGLIELPKETLKDEK